MVFADVINDAARYQLRALTTTDAHGRDALANDRSAAWLS
jgi:hypothetical protein